MINFLQFIEEDIQSKKSLFSTMPTNTKSNKRKYNQKIDAVTEKYEEYKTAVKKYLDAKSKSFDIKDCKETGNISDEISSLEHIRFILNPSNTYLEKMGFDTLFYQINNYHDFKFSSLTDIINEFINKFELVGIKLQKSDFNYTCYVNEFMSSFLEIRDLKSDNYDMVSEIFEKIYWVNPQIIEHVELNFRKLIKKHEKKFIEYIKKLQEEAISKDKLNYDDCLEKLTSKYRELTIAEKEDICDIIKLAKEDKIDINNYFEDSKVRTATFSGLMIEPLNLLDNSVADRFYENLEKLKINIEEYGNYIKFVPLIEDFKNEYLKGNKPDKATMGKNLKGIESQISQKESKLEKLNKKIFGDKGRFSEKKESALKELKFESVKLANELHELYKTLNQEYFKDKVYSVLNSTFTVADLMQLYYSYDYFKKEAIKKVFNISKYEEIIKYSDSFDLFAMNPTNVIIRGVSLYDESNVARIIVNKYRLVNVNISNEDLNADSLELFLDKIHLVLRINEIEKSSTNIEKIWFMVQVAKLDKGKNN